MARLLKQNDEQIMYNLAVYCNITLHYIVLIPVKMVLSKIKAIN